MLVFLRFDCEAWSKVCQFNWKCAKIDMEMTFSFLKIQGKTCQLKHLHRNELKVFNYEVKFFFFQNFGLENPPHNTFYLLKIFSLQSLIGNWWQSPYWNISWRREWVYSHCPGCGVWFGLPSCCAIANWGMSSFNVYFPQINFPYHLSQWDPA